MDSNRIDELLTRYWNCETSLEEEQQLREYFRQDPVPEQWKDAAALFRYFERSKKKSLDDQAFDRGILEKAAVRKNGKAVKILYNTMRIAAGVAVLLMASWFVRKEVRTSTPPEMVDTYNNPQKAFEETKKALLIISKSFGKAEEQAKKINLFNEAKEEIQREKNNKDKHSL